MSFKAKLELDGKVITVLNYMIDVDQQADITGRPTATPTAGKISLTLEMSDLTMEIIRWALSETGTKNGKVIFYNDNLSGILRTIYFENAFCIKYNENFDDEGIRPFTISIVISAKDLSIGDEKHKNNWPMA
ncbi:type VI secretion system tube protein TssD [uncultured Maribacter sp.]|uniref:type VI secretion system tube protein TssD n=1 Tax=uncultured Maribacter sp. TaxID=431308 RepID=UPI0026206954|nr:type VI secretion system tube protein TssD [uncultured Maribacter sp.]